MCLVSRWGWIGVGACACLLAVILVLYRAASRPRQPAAQGRVKVERDVAAQPGRALSRVARSLRSRVPERDLTPAPPRESTRTVAPPVPTRDARPGELILTFYNERERDAFIALARERGAEILDLMSLGNSVRFRVRDMAGFRRLIAEDGTPLSESPNYYVRTPPIPDADRLAPETGYLSFGDQSLRWLGVPVDRSTWGEGITVAVLDTGVAQHEALSAARTEHVDLVVGEGGGFGTHGTAVASLIGGDGESVQGVAPGVNILSVRVMSESGVGDVFTLAKGIQEAVERGAQVINLSLATTSDSPILRAAIDLALSRGVAVVASTGNDAVGAVAYPARYDGVLAVSAVDGAGRHLYFANRGDEVDLAAPGLGVSAAGEDGGVSLFSGTSAAAPFVSGTIAWLLAGDSGLSGADAAELVLQYVSDAGEPGDDTMYGEGILDLRRLAERDEPGVFDVALGQPFLRPAADGQLGVVVYVQNRGTEALVSVDLAARIDGVPHTLSFFNLDVGETASHEFRVAPSDLRASGQVAISLSVSTGDVVDAYPHNNAPLVLTLVYEE